MRQGNAGSLGTPTLDATRFGCHCKVPARVGIPLRPGVVLDHRVNSLASRPADSMQFGAAKGDSANQFGAHDFGGPHSNDHSHVPEI